MGDYHMIPLHSMLRGEGGGPLEGDHWTSRGSRREQGVEEVEGGAEVIYIYSEVIATD